MLPPHCMLNGLRSLALPKVRHAASLASAVPLRPQAVSSAPFSYPPMTAEMLLHVEKPLANMAINFHFTRKCNMSCKFCFHTGKTSHLLREEDCLRLISDLREAGASKLNFAGGEPFLPAYQGLLAAMAHHARDVGFLSVSVITNGSLVKRRWFAEHGRHLTMLGLSCDSLDPATNVAIGRSIGSKNAGDQAAYVRNAAALCREFGINFKINTVVCAANAHEDMTPLIIELQDVLTRWKLFQVLPLAGENTGREGELRDVRPLLITDDAFQAYVARARAGLQRAGSAQRTTAAAAQADAASLAPLSSPSPLEDVLKVEDNATMQSSYLLIDEYGRFLDSSTGGKVPTEPILKVGVREALRQLRASPGGGFNAEAFVKRDGAFYLR